MPRHFAFTITMYPYRFDIDEKSSFLHILFSSMRIQSKGEKWEEGKTTLIYFQWFCFELGNYAAMIGVVISGGHRKGKNHYEMSFSHGSLWISNTLWFFSHLKCVRVCVCVFLLSGGIAARSLAIHWLRFIKMCRCENWITLVYKP